MKIALINDQPFYSGMGKYAFKLFQLLKDKFEIEFLTLDYKTRTLKLNDELILIRDKKIPFIDNKPFFWYRMRNKLPDCGLFHFANQNLSFLIKRPNSIITCHDLAPLIVPDHSSEKIWRRYLYWGIKKAKLVLADSSSTKKDLIYIYGIPEKKIKTIYLGVEQDIFKPIKEKENLRRKLQIPLDAKVILNVGTEKYRKNIRGIIYAFNRLAEKYKDLFLIRVGRRSKKNWSLIKKLGLSERIKYFLDVSENELPNFYNAADIFVMPSYYEGFGLPALEAMSCGIPVVVSNTSSLPEIVGDAGMMINPYSIEDIYKGIDRLLIEKNLYNELKEKGIEQARKFTWQKTADEVASMYKILLKN